VESQDIGYKIEVPNGMMKLKKQFVVPFFRW